MAKTLSNYNPTVNIGGGITPAGGEFPVAESHDILVDATGKRLDTKLDELDAQIGGTGETSVATQLGQKVAKSDITTGAPASTNTDAQVPSTKSMYTALATKPTGTLSTAKPVSGSTDTEIPTSKAVYTGLAEKVNNADITTGAPASTNTDAQVPSTKSMYTALATKPTGTLSTAEPTSSSTDTQIPTAKAVYTGLNKKVNTADIASTVAATGSTSATKVPSETAVREAIEAKTIPLESSVPAAGDSPSATAAPSVAATRTAIDAAIDDASQDFEDAAAALQTSYSTFTSEVDAKIGDPTDAADDAATAVWPRLKNAETDIDALSGQFLITDALTTTKMADNTRFYIYTGKEIHVVNATTDITDTTGNIIYKYIGATSGNYTQNNLYKYDTGTSAYVAVTAADALNITVEGSSTAGTIYRPNYWFYYDINTWKQGSNVSSVTVDSTLSIAGAAADAKATGDAITELSNDVSNLSEYNVDQDVKINNLNTYMYKNTGWISLLQINNKDNIILPKYIEKDVIYYCYNVSKTAILKPYPGFIYCIYDVEPETTYSLHVNLARYVVYDAENNIIDYNMDAGFAEYTTPENAAYIHISANYSSIPNNQLLIFLYKGTKIELESLSYSIPNFIDCNNIPLISPKGTTFFVTSKNLFNKDDPNKETGKYITSVGKVSDNNSYSLFDYIKIKPNTAYCLSSIKTCGCYYSLFNKSFKNTGGQNNVSIYYAPNSDTYKGLQITTGPLDEYIRLSFNHINIADYYIQLEEGEERTEYVDYSYTIDPIYIPAIQNNQENTELDKLIEPQDTTFFIQGKNLIDINKLLDETYINWTNGLTTTNKNYIATDKIKIKPLTEYTISSNLTNNIQYAFYDSNGKYISNSAANIFNSTKHFTITSPELAYYIAISQAKATNSANLLQLEEGAEATSYENYCMYIDNKYIRLDNSNSDLITPEDTTFFVTSKNLLKVDDNSLSRGYYINQTNGNISENALHTTSDYIPIKPNTTYTYSNINQFYGNYRYCIFDINKNYLSGGYLETAVTFTSPSNAAYYRFSAGYNDVKNSMLEEGNQATDYEPYYKAIDPQYILSDNINKSKFPVNLPPKIYALVGYETNIYFDNLVDGYDTQYDFDVACSIGTHLQRCFRVTPTEENVGEYPITIKVTKNDITVTKTATIYVASATAKADELIKLIILGDSTTNNGICVTKLNQNLSTDPMNIITIGTRGSNPNNHEGRSGWKYRTYFTSAGETYTDGRGNVDNPFYNETTETFDIANYFSETNFDHPDWFFINLGINDTFSYSDDVSLNTEIEYLNGLCDEVISQIKDFDENIKIGICLTIPPNYSQDAYGKAYKNGQTRNRYKRNNILWVENQIENYKNREDENIYIIPLNLCLDTVYNMGLEEIQVNARNTTTYFSPIANGGVHPVESGYWQCADVYTAFLKNV